MGQLIIGKTADLVYEWTHLKIGKTLGIGTALAPHSARAHAWASRKRNRSDVKALKKAVKRNRAASVEAGRLRQWSTDCHDATRGALMCAREIVRRALERVRCTDTDLIARLERVCDRIELHVEANRLAIKPDDLAELRILAREVAAKLICFAGSTQKHEPK
jgi:hypothetical protein